MVEELTIAIKHKHMDLNLAWATSLVVPHHERAIRSVSGAAKPFIPALYISAVDLGSFSGAYFV